MTDLDHEPNLSNREKLTERIEGMEVTRPLLDSFVCHDDGCKLCITTDLKRTDSFPVGWSHWVSDGMLRQINLCGANGASRLNERFVSAIIF